MHQLIHEKPLNFGGDVTFPEFRRIRDGIRQTVQKIKEYRRANPRWLVGGHVLHRLVNSLPISTAMDLERFNYNIGAQALLFTQSLQMTSAMSRGKLWQPGAFLGASSQEILIATSDDWDLDQAESNWQDLAPIRYLWHPMSSLTYPLTDGIYKSKTPGVSVIAINIPMLAVQYRQWRMSQNIAEDSPQNIGQFLQMYAIPNMLDSYVDIALFNRLLNIYNRAPNVREDYKHTFFITDWEGEVDRVMERLLYYGQNRHWLFDTTIKNIPTVFANTMHDVLRLPEMAYTVQMQWAVLMARIDWVEWLVNYNHDTDNQVNRSYLNYLDRHFKYLDGNRSLANNLPRDLYERIQFRIDQGIRPLL